MSVVKVNRIIETVIYVKDLEKSEQFYTKLFGLKQALCDEKERECLRKQGEIFLRAGKSILEICDATKTLTNPNLPSHGATCSPLIHFAFEVGEKEDIKVLKNKVKDILKEYDKDIVCVKFWGSSGYSIYFRDPDNNLVELITSDVWRKCKRTKIRQSK